MKIVTVQDTIDKLVQEIEELKESHKEELDKIKSLKKQLNKLGAK